MASADDAHSRPKRPTAMTRQSSSQSHLSEGELQRAPHKAQRHHVVGHQRVQRNLSTGKNLNKLNKAAQQIQQAEKAAEKEARHHRRTKSGDSVSAPSSPRPSFKRNASSGAVVRVAHQAHTQANLRRNHSSGQLPRTGQGKYALKSAKNELASGKKSLTPARSRQASPEPHAAVHFDMGDDDDEEGGDEGWTEESASQSPTTTRSNTRSNSVILDAQHKLAERNMENNRGDPAQVGASRQPPAQSPQTLPDRSRATASTNGSNSHHARLPDADMITSRLLQRSASHTVPPQTTSVAATVGTATERHTTMVHSAGSTLVDTPGKDLVSRFMDGDGSAGTPHDGGYMPASKTAQPGDGELDQSKRNKSMPNVNAQDTPDRTPSRSGTTTPTTNLPPSRTQQKLMLQRASSNIEPQKLVPVTLPRTGGPNFLQSGINYNANGEGRLDPRLQQQFNHVAVEYSVVRRYRNPVADSILRIQQIPGVSGKTRIPRTGSANGSASAHSSASLSTSFSEAGIETDGASSRRSARVSFDNEHGRPKSRRDDGDVEGHQSFESARSHARPASEAEEICRRLWESAEIMEAD